MPRKTRAGRRGNWPVLILASMRPRPDAAENSGGASFPNVSKDSFNEAAARCRGKLHLAFSMPRPTMSFNEAAARCRGKPWADAAAPGKAPPLQ